MLCSCRSSRQVLLRLWSHLGKSAPICRKSSRHVLLRWMDPMLCLYGESKPSSLSKAKTSAKTRHVCLYDEPKPLSNLASTNLYEVISASSTPMNSVLTWLYGDTKPSSLVKEKTTAKTCHVCLYGEAKPVEELGIEAAKRGRRTRNIGAALGECSIMTKRSC